MECQNRKKRFRIFGFKFFKEINYSVVKWVKLSTEKPDRNRLWIFSVYFSVVFGNKNRLMALSQPILSISGFSILSFRWLRSSSGPPPELKVHSYWLLFPDAGVMIFILVTWLGYLRLEFELNNDYNNNLVIYDNKLYFILLPLSVGIEICYYSHQKIRVTDNHIEMRKLFQRNLKIYNWTCCYWCWKPIWCCSWGE